ncbi:MAG TPA: hypothetical protein VK181_09700 [Rhizobium sp.]|nr:hypothetical protein [Rhizobium sp.]
MYEQHNVSAMTDIPAIVGDFANYLGFDVDLGTPTTPIVAVPESDALPFKLTASASTLQWQVETPLLFPQVTSKAVLTSPKLSGAPNIPAPTKIHLFGDMTPRPYLAVVVEYTPNLFRHLYLGSMEKLGNYSGGEIIGANGGPINSSGSSLDWRDQAAVKTLFQGASSLYVAGDSGGVNIVHGDVATPWKQFRAPTSNIGPFDDFTDVMALGGFGDSINDGYVPRARSPFASVNIFAPINIYIAKPVIADTSFIPVGRVPGIRHVNMQDLPVAAMIEVSNEKWHCFPALSRRAETSMPVGTNNWRQYETSNWFGYAYREGPA